MKKNYIDFNVNFWLFVGPDQVICFSGSLQIGHHCQPAFSSGAPLRPECPIKGLIRKLASGHFRLLLSISWAPLHCGFGHSEPLSEETGKRDITVGCHTKL